MLGHQAGACIWRPRPQRSIHEGCGRARLKPFPADNASASKAPPLATGPGMPLPPRTYASAGEAVAKKRRMPSAKGFDFFVEASYVELYDEACHDLLSKGPGAGAALPVSSNTCHNPPQPLPGSRLATAQFLGL